MWPAVFLLIFGIVQAGIWYHARNVALTAAHEGARAGSLGESGDGAARAAEFVADTASTSLLRVDEISQEVGEGSVTVTVTGESTTLVPGWTIDVSQSSTAPIRRWTDP
ncbi:TadE-like protein [Haloactinopolyspora alba]|uniref:TadE-like protein n=1 Tax=Haloactinopolyspora alba TaxID=648780 RepID=A0A2P8E798_9ACTN|nr:TadE-like protein [Haloactinopolyspora alba]